MKTYTKEVEEARLVIEHDGDAESPRADDTHIGYLFTKESRYKSPDGNMHTLYHIMIDTEDEAENTEQHIKLMRERAHEAFMASGPTGGNSHDEDLHVIDIYPVYRYEHGNVAYRRGTAGGFDYSSCGFYFVTAQGISGSTWDDDKIPARIDDELEEYTKWCNGEVYRFTLYDENGVVEESCGGFYDINDIKEYLPDDWKNEDLESYIRN